MLKRIVLTVCSLMMLAGIAMGDTTLYTLGPLSLHLPMSNGRVTYAYDGVAKQNVVGAETVVLTGYKLEGTAGALTSIQGSGTPFLGLNLNVPNPVANQFNLGDIKPGILGGYNFNTHSFLIGPKFSVNLF